MNSFQVEQKHQSMLAFFVLGNSILFFLLVYYYHRAIKFSASPESVYIFSQVGIELWRRKLMGVMELIAAILLVIPRTSVIGALLAAGLMAGAMLRTCLCLI